MHTNYWTYIVKIKVNKLLKNSIVFIVEVAHKFSIKKKDAHKFEHSNLTPQ